MREKLLNVSLFWAVDRDENTELMELMETVSSNRVKCKCLFSWMEISYFFGLKWINKFLFNTL